MIKEVDIKDLKGTKIYEDEETGRTYQAIAAALSWPGLKTGYLVIGALEQGEDCDDSKSAIHIMKDRGIRSTHELLKETDHYQGIFKFQTVYLDNRSRAMMQTFYDYQGEKKDAGGSVGWGCSKAPFLEDPKCLEYYVGKIRERMTPGMKSLFFAEDSILPGLLASVKYEELKNATIEDQPAIFALGAVVCSIDSHKNTMEIVHEAELALEEQMMAKYERNYRRRF